ncbi:hypothetical protein ACHAW6_001286 [Cyclotella cf. meneghiniana]
MKNTAAIRSATIALKKHNDASMLRDCECFEKLVFCGYDVYMNDNDNNSRSKDVLSGNADRNARGDTMPIDQTVKEIPNTHARYTLWGSSTTADDVKGMGYLWKGNHYPSLESDVIQFRRETLLGMNLVKDNYSGNTNEWKFVGLAQWSY